MRHVMFVIGCLFLSWHWAEQPLYCAVRTEVASDLCLELYTGHGTFSMNELISYGFLTKTNSCNFVYFPKPEFFCRFELVASDGKAVSKTSLGRKYGARFWELNKFSDGVIETRKRPGQGKFMRNVPALPSGVVAQQFHRLSDLFKVERPGTYSFKLQMQVFKSVEDRSGYHFELVRFSELTIKVVQPDPLEKQTKP